jgi:hypothetical protein
MEKLNLLAIYKSLDRPIFKKNTYVTVYEELFKGIDNPTLVEVGVLGGGSLELWAKYFGTKAKILGVDLNPAAKFTAPAGVEVYILDQSLPKEWDLFWNEIGNVDILIDDGGHLDHQQIVTVIQALPYISEGGLVIVEDTDFSYRAELKNPSKRSFISFVFSCIDVINSRDRQVRLKLTPEQEIIARHVSSIQIFTTMVVFKINQKECVETAPMVINRSGEALPIDFRLHGMPHSPIRKLQSKARSSVILRYMSGYKTMRFATKVLNNLISKFVRW